MESDLAIRIQNLGKCYQVYKNPFDRLKQSFYRNRRKLFTEFWALKSLSLDIKRGETIGVVGANGSGKSTLLQLLCDIVKPTIGEIEIRGRVAGLLELGAGFNPEFTGRENIRMNAAIMGLSKEEIEAHFDEIVAFANIGRFIDQPVKTYSSGMYVRLAFATAINVSPDILLVDEALSVGDARFQQKCLKKMKQFCENGTVVFVSHDTYAITDLCDRVIWIDEGKLRMTGSPNQVVNNYLQFMYTGDEPAAFENRSFDASPSSGGNEVSACDGFSKIESDVDDFGDGRVTIEARRFFANEKLNSVACTGDFCEIGMLLYVHEDIRNPAAGYILKDRIGREIFGDNTLLHRTRRLESLAPGKHYILRFFIENWPNLLEGEYVISLAVGEGGRMENVPCHWVHDAIVVKSRPYEPPVGVISIPSTRFDFAELKSEQV